ncbi:MAG: DNA/RNA non-specific endonuclease [Burkholderiales bacterium]|nr:DNA/RNA non-specific endonuclease [Burkholderiales bacterium]
MAVIYEQIEKAIERAKEVDLPGLVSNARDLPPRELADDTQIEERRQFLRESLGDAAVADLMFERIIGGNELQDVNFLIRGAVASRAIARIEIRSASGRLQGYGTGFLIAPGVLLTNHHVLPEAGIAQNSLAQFDYERDLDGRLKPIASFELLPGELFHADKALDFAVVAVKASASNVSRSITEFGLLPLVGRVGKVAEGEWLTIIQHPAGEVKQLCVRENKLLKRASDVLWYSTDTLGGSSGSPVFNNDWFVVALHHSGVPARRGTTILNVDGTDHDPLLDPDGRNIKWQANEGIRVSRIVEHLRNKLGEHPRIQAILRGTVEDARIPDPTSTQSSEAPHSAPIPSVDHTSLGSLAMSNAVSSIRTVSVRLSISPEGLVSVVGSNESNHESYSLLEASRAKIKPPKFDVAFDFDYDKRKGFNEQFLGAAHEVHLPQLSRALKNVASKLLNADGSESDEYVLNYHNYSLVMNAHRRFAIYTAANVRADQRFDVGRPSDVWRTDPRIPIEHQITDFYYKSNAFDRGHLTRREDLEYGKTLNEALASAADTCHWTNCTPQHSKFNQNKELWQGIERHVLEGAIMSGQYNCQVFTGPLLEEDDPVYPRHPDIQYPVRFWKVVATLTKSKKLFATAFILDQSGVIDEHGYETTEVPIGPYKTFQVKITEVERLTGLKFTYGKDNKSLSDVDPIAGGLPRSRRRQPRLEESTGINKLPEGYVPLLDTSEIVLAD